MASNLPIAASRLLLKLAPKGRTPAFVHIRALSSGAGPVDDDFSHVFKDRTNPQLVVGCGSNVVDNFFRVRSWPGIGEKGFFEDSSSSTLCEQQIVGGVTLNHLSWAAAMGVPTGLLALQGEDEDGRLIRSTMKVYGVSRRHLVVNNRYRTSVSQVFVDTTGERAIVMSPGSTSLINDVTAERCFAEAVQGSAMLTTEISQVPLSGVKTLLTEASNAGVLSMLDVDVPPSVATGGARLGKKAALLECLALCNVLKPSMQAALELLALPECNQSGTTFGEGSSPAAVARALLDSNLLPFTSLVAVTDSKMGCGLAIDGVDLVVPPYEITLTDATGAGDAFFGGMIAAAYYWGLPKNEAELIRMGQMANASGAACCEVMGALPSPDISLPRIRTLIPHDVTEAATMEYEIRSNKKYTEDASPPEAEMETSDVIFEKSLNVDAEVLSGFTTSNDLGDVEAVVDLLDTCDGCVYTTGIGKSGIVAQRLAASLKSVGVCSNFVHLSEWVHGDLGLLRNTDVVITISNGGNSHEMLDVMDKVKRTGVTLAALVGDPKSSLAVQCANHVLHTGPVPSSAEPLGKVPAGSLVIQEAVCNGLVRTLVEKRAVTPEDFRRNHPGGTIGQMGKEDAGW